MSYMVHAFLQRFREQLRRFLFIFFDEILVFSKTWEEHLQHLEMVLSILEEESPRNLSVSLGSLNYYTLGISLVQMEFR